MSFLKIFIIAEIWIAVVAGSPKRLRVVNVIIGSTAVLPCNPKVQDDVMWEFEDQHGNSPKELASTGIVLNDDVDNVFNNKADRVFLVPSTTGNHNLMIIKTRRTDSGVYVCTENDGAGLKHYVALNVFDVEVPASDRITSSQLSTEAESDDSRLTNREKNIILAFYIISWKSRSLPKPIKTRRCGL